MSFFADVASKVGERRREPEPKWIGPPNGVVPGQSSQLAVVFRTDQTLLVLRQFDVYPNGVEFTVDLRVRRQAEPPMDMPFEQRFPPGRPGHTLEDLPAEFLRLGFSFGDGSTWANFLDRFPRMGEEPSSPVVIGRGGSGGGDFWNMRYWMWPLPPPGKIVVYAAWPMFDIDETSADLDGTALRDAAGDAEIVWD